LNIPEMVDSTVSVGAGAEESVSIEAKSEWRADEVESDGTPRNGAARNTATGFGCTAAV
jgi:hypothetical protein